MPATAADATADAPSVTIPLRSRRARRAEVLLPLRDAIAALALAWAALPRFASGVAGEVALATADVLVALALVVAIVREHRSAASHRTDGHDAKHERVAWTEVAAALMLFVEAYHQRAEGRPGRLLPYATAFVGLVTLLKGLNRRWFAARVDRRRVLRLDGEGMLFRWSRLHRVWVPRAEIAALTATERAVVVTRPDGSQRTVSLRDALEPARVAAAVREWAEASGIAVR